jgi:hypothetical protein
MNEISPEASSSPSPLFTPSLQQFAEPSARPARPWSPRAQFFVAFFGGITALGIFALVNARRLRVSRNRMALMVVLILVAWTAYWAGTQILPTLPLDAVFGTSISGPSGRVIRIAGRAVALLLYLALYWIQKPADRIYGSLRNGTYARPWRAGFAACALGILIDLAVAIFFVLRSR